MKKQSQSFKNLIMKQMEEPLITHINPEGNRVFGLKRFSVANVHITRAVRPHAERYVQLIGEPFDIELKSGYITEAYEIFLIRED